MSAYVSAPCGKCNTFGMYGSPHTVTINKEKRTATLICKACGSGWRVDLAHIPDKAPKDVLIQSINNAIVSGLATPLEANARYPDEEAEQKPGDRP